METIETIIRERKYRNNENGYSVLTVTLNGEEQTVTGFFPFFSSGEKIVFNGEWQDNHKYGMQFVAQTFHTLPMTEEDVIFNYLAGGAVRGIKEVLARRIVDTFGAETLTVLSEYPERLIRVPGIGRKNLITIVEGFKESQELRAALMFLQNYEITGSIATRIAEKYKDKTEEILRNNPYILCHDLDGVGFKKADQIAQHMGTHPADPHRIEEALIYVLRQAASNAGHTYLPQEMLLSLASELLGVETDLCVHALDMLVLTRQLIRSRKEEDPIIFLNGCYQAEKAVAYSLKDLTGNIPPYRESDIRRRIDVFQRENGITFSPMQRQAILSSLENSVFIITGGPGTGKTTLIKCILALLEGEEIELCAPTGRAAKRMKETTGTESKTIHRLLKYNPVQNSFAVNAENPLETDCVIMDEASMVDVFLMKALVTALLPGTRLIIVGDSDQLPSVGAGNVLSDLLASGKIPSVHLDTIYRQTDTSRIALNAHRINIGELPLLNEKDTDSFLVRAPTPVTAANSIVSLITQRLPAFMKIGNQMPSEVIQVLSPTKKGDCGAIQLNKLLQATLNPPAPGVPQLLRENLTLRPKDKVIQTKNNYTVNNLASIDNKDSEIYNGDIGTVLRVYPDENMADVWFDEDHVIRYAGEALNDLDLAYCLTVHKSQGSEFPAVILPAVSGPQQLLTRNLFYTALTRAKQLVVIVGQEEIIRQMVMNNDEKKRYTALKERLTECFD